MRSLQIILVFVIGLLILTFAVDYAAGTEIVCQGEIISKSHQHYASNFYYIPDGNGGMIPVYEPSSDDYALIVQGCDRSFRISVDEDSFALSQQGQAVTVKARIGKFSKAAIAAVIKQQEL